MFNSFVASVGQEKFRVPERNRTHELWITGRMPTTPELRVTRGKKIRPCTRLIRDTARINNLERVILRYLVKRHLTPVFALLKRQNN